MSIETLIAEYGLAALFVGAGVEGETVVVTGGVLAHRGLVPLWGAMAVTASGAFLADQLLFALGRRYRDHPRVRRIMARRAFARALRTLEKYPVGFILIFRFLYGLRTVSPVAIGTSSVAAGRFMVLNGISAAVWGTVFTGLGYGFGGGIEKVMRRFVPRIWHLPNLIAAAAGIAAIILIIRLIRARRAEHAARDVA